MGIHLYSIRTLLKRIRLRLYDMLLRFMPKKYSRVAKISVKQSEEILEAFSKKPNGKSIRKNNLHKPFEYDLQIIVPAYNVENYLRPCIESILSQKTQYKYFLVLVDDGSTDNTGAVADSFANDQRVKIIHQENKGFSGARNTALQNIYANYIMFVDSDDMLVQGAIEQLLRVAYQNKAEIVQGEFYELYKDGQVDIKQPNGEAKLVYPALGNLKGFPWGKVFANNLFENIVFPDGFWFEDSVLSFLMYPRVERAFTMPQIVYIYRKTNVNSISNTAPKKPKCVDSFYITDLLMDEHSEVGLPIDQVFVEKVFRQIVLNARRMAQMPEEIKEAIFVLTCDMVETKLPCSVSSKTYSGLIRAIRARDYGAFCFYIKMFG